MLTLRDGTFEKTADDDKMAVRLLKRRKNKSRNCRSDRCKRGTVDAKLVVLQPNVIESTEAYVGQGYDSEVQVL